MRKSTVARIWLGGLVALVAGIVAILAGGLTIAANSAVYGGGGGTELQPTYDAFFWWMVAVIVVGALAVVAGGIAQVVAWIGALVDTYAAPEKTWFVVLLVGGLTGFIGVPFVGFVVMVVYLLVGPDVQLARTAGTAPMPPPGTLAAAH